ncbi:hypothetical protein [Anaerotruncus colihominis]|uniref:hypothetical protein n=1 Tax=Anaerotruncus colihominis TaxID=169435 RepID=UPI0034E98B5B
MLGIRPRGTDSVEARRAAVLARLNEQLPFTERTLRLMLDGVCLAVLSRRTWSLTWSCGTTRTGCSGRGCTGCCAGRRTARCVRRCLLERKQMVWASNSGTG